MEADRGNRDTNRQKYQQKKQTHKDRCAKTDQFKWQQ